MFSVENGGSTRSIVLQSLDVFTVTRSFYLNVNMVSKHGYGSFRIMGSANERRHYIETPPLIGWTHNQNYLLWFVKYGKNSVFFINRFKNHILYDRHGNKYGQKNYTSQKNIIWTPDYCFMILWKRISKLFTKFGWHICSDTPVHWGWNTYSLSLFYWQLSWTTETEMSSFWLNFSRWLHWKLSNDNFQCSQRWKFRQNDEIFVSVTNIGFRASITVTS